MSGACRASVGGRHPIAGGWATPPSLPVADPYACVIDPCAFARTGLSALVARRYPGEVVALEGLEAYATLPLALRGRPVSVLVYRLPAVLGPLLDSLCFLRRFLAQHAHAGRVPPPVLLLTDTDPFWLHDTLCGLLRRDGGQLSTVSTLPARSALPPVRAVLGGSLPGALLLRRAVSAPRRPGLSPAEVAVMRDFLVYGIPVPIQARLAGASVKTLYTQRRTAMRKLGVSSLAALLRWGRPATSGERR